MTKFIYETCLFVVLFLFFVVVVFLEFIWRSVVSNQKKEVSSCFLYAVV